MINVDITDVNATNTYSNNCSNNECLLKGSDIIHNMHYIFQYICVYGSVSVCLCRL